ncbi:MAG: hypothetical protein JTT14_02300 [Candidatus Brockarchaeota archaeon]|nr:hypothetical protein [Candidatus Brockarchaeota archaeon]
MSLKANVRSKIDQVTSSIIIGIATYCIFATIPALPQLQLLSIVFAILLCLFGLKSLNNATKALAAIFLMILFYQFWGLGVFGLLAGNFISKITFIILCAPVYAILSFSDYPASVALAIISVTLLLTPYYYLSVATIIAAAAMVRTVNMSSIALTFIFLTMPFLALNNALYFLQNSAATSPILFSQLNNLVDAFRPPLSSLNLFVSGLPENFFFKEASVLLKILESKILTLIIPWALLGVTFAFSSEVAGMIIVSKKWIENAVGKDMQILNLILPTISSLATPIVFLAFLTFFSAPQIGSYSIELNTMSSFYMVLGSIVLGSVFTGREYLIIRLEEVERLRAVLSNLLAKAEKATYVAKESISIGSETHISFKNLQDQLDGIISFTESVRRSFETAGEELLRTWINELSTKIADAEKIPETVRTEIINEVNTLRSLIDTYNSYLQEVKIDFRLENIEMPEDIFSLKILSDYYNKIVNSVEKSVKEGYNLYTKELKAYYNVFERKLEVLPTDPSAMLSSRQYASAMKIVFEDYIYNFFFTRNEQLYKTAGNITNALEELKNLAAVSVSDKIGRLLSSLSAPKPSVIESVILETVKIMESAVSNAKLEAEEFTKMIGSYEISKLIRIEAYSYIPRLETLLVKIKNLRPTIIEFQDTLSETLTLLKDFNEAKKVDENNLILISSYLSAERVIESMLANKRNVHVRDLPFERNIAILFAKMYVLNKNAVYDEEREVILSEM